MTVRWCIYGRKFYRLFKQDHMRMRKIQGCKIVNNKLEWY